MDYAIEQITNIERVGDFEDEYVYDIIMEDETTPYFFANGILVHNSCFISMEDIVNKRFGDTQPDNKTVMEFLVKFNEKMIAPIIREYFEKLSYAMNMRELTIDMEPECIANASLHTAKKRYIMNKVWDEGTILVDKPKLKVRGIEIVRTSSPQWIRDKLKEAVNVIFETLSNDKLINFIASAKSEFFKLPFEKVAFPRSVTFSDYTLQSKGLPIGVRAALKYNDFIKKRELTDKYRLIGDGEKIKFAYIVEPNHLKSDVVGILGKMPEELLNVIKIDYETQFNKTFFEPILKLCVAMNWKTEKTSSLEDFFS